MDTDTAGEAGARLELWAGVEATVNRVGDRYFDQLERSGHAHRERDLERIASLGATRVRYPVLWERVAPGAPTAADWSWPDRRLARLRELGVAPIVGLVHHGSGPRHTSLLDPSFPYQLAEYARAVAERYPWVDAYTPVNEPLTTARFSALYGHWHPHARDDHAFLRAVLLQCRAVVLAMRAIREVNPAARLVQTEDVGRVHATPTLAYQAAFENDRRWLSFDLLCGRLDPQDRLWRFARDVGIAASELAWFRDNPCSPDVVGVNYYLSSERFLDSGTDRYPGVPVGGNGRHRYVDIEAARAREEGIAGPAAILHEVWERYRLPIAVTEAHNGCTREEQLRWFLEVWDAAEALRRGGADVRAVTAWSVFGAYDWDSLVTRDAGRYEPGVFDVRGPEPRPTAMVAVLRSLARGQRPSHAVLAQPGWWHRPERLRLAPAVGCGRNARPVVAFAVDGAVPPLLVLGATGTLGRAFGTIAARRGLPYRLLSRAECDLAVPGAAEAVLAQHRPWAVVNAAGYVRVDEAERDAARCFRENRDGAERLAAAAAEHGVPLVTFSSDLVFDGRTDRPYVEIDGPAPLNVYGRSKAEAETRVLACHPGALVIRTSAFFGPWDEHNLVTVALRALAAGERWTVAADVIVSPTYVPDLADATLDLLIDGERGIWHLVNAGAVSWAELVRMAAEAAGVPGHGLDARPLADLGLEAARPRYSALGSERGVLLPPLADAVMRYARDAGRPWAPPEAPGRRALEA